jgi:hypothetical protein
MSLNRNRIKLSDQLFFNYEKSIFNNLPKCIRNENNFNRFKNLTEFNEHFNSLNQK